MASKKRKKKHYKKIAACALSLCAVAAVASYFLFFAGSGTLEGSWERVAIRATESREEQLPAAERSILSNQLLTRHQQESMEKQFFDDGTGIRILTIDNNPEHHTFRWSTAYGYLTTIEGGMWEVTMSYELSGSRLVLVNTQDEEVWEFMRIER